MRTFAWEGVTAAFMGRNRERLLLQLAVVVACLVPLSAGAIGAVQGPAMIRHIPQGVAIGADLQSHFRYLSGLLFGLGVAFAATVPSIERRSEVFLALCGAVVAGGLARLLGVFAAGPPTRVHQLALLMELVVVPLLLVWQRKISRRFQSNAALPPRVAGDA